MGGSRYTQFGSRLQTEFMNYRTDQSEGLDFYATFFEQFRNTGGVYDSGTIAVPAPSGGQGLQSTESGIPCGEGSLIWAIGY